MFPSGLKATNTGKVLQVADFLVGGAHNWPCREKECSLCWLFSIKKCFAVCCLANGKRNPGERRAEGRGLREWENTGKGPRQEGIQRQTVISQPNLVRYYSQGTSVGVKTAIHHGANTVS